MWSTEYRLQSNSKIVFTIVKRIKSPPTMVVSHSRGSDPQTCHPHIEHLILAIFSKNGPLIFTNASHEQTDSTKKEKE